MPLRLDIKRQLSARSDRVKGIDIHPTEPWLLVALYNGSVHVWNYNSQTKIKTFEVTELPVRAARFIDRKNWIVTGSDDMRISVFNYNTLEKAHSFEAHTDYIRALAVHPTQSYVLSSSDDATIRMWDWNANWECKQASVFEGHSHYVMAVTFNPKDTNTFASCSLDRTIKVWQLGAAQPNFTLQGHAKGVNCIDYFPGGEKPYLVSGADDCTVKIWDYQSKACVATLEGHTQNVCAVAFHPELPIVLTGAEDGTIRVWHSNTYRLENTLNYGMERVWAMSCRLGTNNVAIAYDDGAIMVKLGREEPAMSMDNNGKIIVTKHNEVQQANVLKLEDSIKDGEPLPLAMKELGSCEIFPQSLSHNPNGRFVVVCGDGEYNIHTALSFRNKAFGQALEFVWGADASEYATRESSSKVKLFKNFKEKATLKPDFSAEGIFGGTLLGVRGFGTLSFYDWESLQLIRRIEIDAVNVFWSEAGDKLTIVTNDDTFYMLSYNADAVAEVVASGGEIDEEGIEDALEVLEEIADSVNTACWVGDCFIYTNKGNRLNYYVGGEIVTVSHMDRSMYLLGYLSQTGRVYLGDKDLNIISYKLPLAVLEYQTAVMRGDFEAADEVMPNIPADQRTRVAHFLEKRGFKEQALVVSTDAEHRFELALSLHKLIVARELAQELDNVHKWKLLAEAAMQKSMFDLAEECLAHAHDYSGQLLLYSSAGKADKLQGLACDAVAEGKHNIGFLALFLQGKASECIDLLLESNRVAEAALFARTYVPSRVEEITAAWKESLSKSRPKLSQALASPSEYENLFPNFQESLQLEAALKARNVHAAPASQYQAVQAERQVPAWERNLAAAAATTSSAQPAAPVDAVSAPAPEEAVEEAEEQEIEDDDLDFGDEEEVAAPAETIEQPADEQEEQPEEQPEVDDLDDDLDLDLDDVDATAADDLDEDDLLAD
ncbi:uncharacterized protein MONBRDRAFT_39343 [Monosiga brevicollis MX1]|uniref:Coatomer subunit beta' n=1 Tax=Monosiga brevicollis TaxID=81824 RepID=A9VDW9_MONBE|nr:uncharacterized protein MONBRDRAFT_39343 [Monosiga brevicollis MX1]EDQ84291.1 predicted protein [Monosiga brevicollis MX1]|eukprot:XP_001750921.1 hypothetical protein [Monosiga brevicollis MX1]